MSDHDDFVSGLAYAGELRGDVIGRVAQEESDRLGSWPYGEIINDDNAKRGGALTGNCVMLGVKRGEGESTRRRTIQE